MKHKFVFIQVIALVLLFGTVFALYPKVSVSLNEDKVTFYSIGSNTIEISKNGDFSNSKFIGVDKSATIKLEPGEYYWKASNSFIQSFEKKIVVDSKVALNFEESDEGDKLRNVGNVKINVTKTENGSFVVFIYLSPYDEFIENNESGYKYEGREKNEM